jgi:mRNA-degrading endonuclease RelE of RelBE toxin-antitoxin system
MAFRIELTPEARDHLDDLTARQRTRLLDSVARQLAHEPDLRTRNRAPLRPNPLAQFRLRVGDLRAYYDVALAERLVLIKAIGIKRRDRVVVGGVEIRL